MEHGHATLVGRNRFLWKLLSEKDCSEEDLVEALLGEYDVSREIAARDVHAVVKSLEDNGIFA